MTLHGYNCNGMSTVAVYLYVFERRACDDIINIDDDVIMHSWLERTGYLSITDSGCGSYHLTNLSHHTHMYTHAI